jgi:GNAT superfamily N-acetyltransferase
MFVIRPCRETDLGSILAIINAAATAYRGVIPDDCWHEPYMSSWDLSGEIAAGVVFCGYEVGGALAGVMGIQRVRDVHLIRHAYVLPEWQRHGVGTKLIGHLLEGNLGQRTLVGTWAAAHWAIDFYRRHGFAQVSPELKTELLQAYWSVSSRQRETSVVLARTSLSEGGGLKRGVRQDGEPAVGQEVAVTDHREN